MGIVRKLVILILGLALITVLVLLFLPAQLEKSMNTVLPHEAYEISGEALRLHNSLFIADLHADTTLWDRSLLERSERGHVDVPRMREGNVALQMFTTVTKSPRGQNYEQNSSEAADNITSLAIVQSWPVATWSSLKARALYQAQRLKEWEEAAPDEFMLIYSKTDLLRLVDRRSRGEYVVGGMIGTEGSHALDGEVSAVDELFNAGFRMMSLQHFFDNKLGGSLHGTSQSGLSGFGREAVSRMSELGVMIDLSHSSENVVNDVLDIVRGPTIVSHTGFQGHCDSPRNISDATMQKIADYGGLIGVGFWDAAVCDPSPKSIAAAMRYGVDLVGLEHIALGSDFDGSVETALDSSELSVLTEEMLKAGFSEQEIRRVMGGNVVRYLAENLPE
jgi:membrane dipeptidase